MKNKRIIALALAAGIAVSGSGIGEMAEATRTSFDFTVKAEKKDTTENVQKTYDGDSASANVTTYKNTTNKSYLRLRVLRGKTAVTNYQNVNAVTKYRLKYKADKSVMTGQSFKLRGYVAEGVTKGTGTMKGVFQP